MGTKVASMAGQTLSVLLALCTTSTLLLRAGAQESTTLEPQLLGSSAVVRKAVSKMYVFGGMGTNSTSPINKIYEFDMTQRLWTELIPVGSDVPSGRMFHTASLSSDSRYMYIYGGIACFQIIQMRSLETGLKEYHMQQDSIEYSQGLEDVWVYDFVTNMWLELSPLRTQTRGDCITADGVTRIQSGAGRTQINFFLPILLPILSIWMMLMPAL